MARKPTDKQLFKMKNEWLGQFYEEVKPKDFYRAVFLWVEYQCHKAREVSSIIGENMRR